MLQELCRKTKGEMAPLWGSLLGVYKVKGTANEYRVMDTYVNRIVLGYALPEIKLENLTFYEGLKDFQVSDVRRMVAHNSFLNRNRMGSGKTIETIYACRNRNFKSILVVCPKSVSWQWVVQFKRWWKQRAQEVELIGRYTKITQGKIYVTNYEKLLSNPIQSMLRQQNFDCIIADEAHYIKNHKAKRSQCLKELKALCKYALTGTPVLRTPDELFSIFEFLDERISGKSYWEFVEYFCEWHEGYYGREIKGLTKNPEHVSVLHDLLNYMSCYNDIEVANGKKEILVPLVLTGAQNVLYKNLSKLILQEIDTSVTIPNGAVLRTRLIQATSSPQVLKVNTPGVKFEWIREILETLPNEKIVVFSNYAEPLINLRTYLKKNGFNGATYTGRQSAEERFIAKQTFISKPDCRILVGTIGALGVGVDELQTVAHICIFLDRHPSPEINAQCEDRLRRMGQRHEVLCYYLECDKTIDKKVARVSLERAEDIKKALLEVD